MINWLAGGSPYVPKEVGKGVPIELQLAVHSDAGYKQDGSFVGTLGICTTVADGQTTYGSRSLPQFCRPARGERPSRP